MRKMICGQLLGDIMLEQNSGKDMPDNIDMKANEIPEDQIPHLHYDAGKYFSPTAPIDAQNLFAGRTAQVNRVLDAVSQRGQNVVIFGERGVGKTSLSNVLASFLSRAGCTILAPKVNCVDTDDYASIWRRIFSGIYLNELDKRIGFTTAQPTMTVKTVADSIYEPVTPDVVFKYLKFLADKGALVIAIVDEFDRVTNETVSRQFADTIKLLSDYPISATLILVGVADSVDELRLGHQSVERALVQVQMPRMSTGELTEIVNNGLKGLKMESDPAIISQIVNLSKGLPHYTHLLGLHTAREAIKNSTRLIQSQHLADAIKKSIEDAQQSIRSGYYKATTSPRKENLYSQVLLACALCKADDLGFFAPADVRGPLSKIMGKPYEIPAFARHLNDFCDATRGPILQKAGASRRFRFRFKNPLMQPFIVLKGFESGMLKE